MTPEQIDAVTDGLIGLGEAVDTYGPGLLLAGAVVAAWWLCARIAGAIYDRIAAAHQKRGIRRLEHYANQSGARAHDNPREETP